MIRAHNNNNVGVVGGVMGGAFILSLFSSPDVVRLYVCGGVGQKSTVTLNNQHQIT
jgi:hypothetical protein